MTLRKRGDVHLSVVGQAPTTRAAEWTLPPGLADVAVYGDELLAEGEGADAHVVDGLVGGTDLVLLSGREKESFKTWLLLDLAIARIQGAHWLGRSVALGKPSRVLFISAETSARNIARRLRALCLGRGIDPAKVAPFLVVVDQAVTMIPRSERERAGERKLRDVQLAGAKAIDPERSKVLTEGARLLAEVEASSLGSNLAMLASIEEAPAGTFGLVLVDTLRACMKGDENSSDDGRRYNQACRELARAVGCPIFTSHHNGKGSDESSTRSARGTTEITAGPDVVITLSVGGESNTATYRCRNVEEPAPTGYRLDVRPDGSVRVETCEPSVGEAADGITADDVMVVFTEKGEHGLTLTSVRKLVAEARGGASGAKAKDSTVRKHLATLVARGAISPCTIETSKGKSFEGWVVGKSGGTFAGIPPKEMGRKRRDEEDDGEPNPFKAPRLPGVR